MRELHEQRGRALSFGSVADAYDRVRPTYPEAMIRDLLMTDPHDVLDVGCGTGRAARLLADKGCRVLGVEPDPGMASVARGHGIEVEVGTFEEWDDAGRRFDLLVSGQAWHWVDPVAGAAKARSVLTAGGSVALFWNMDSLPAEQRAVLDAAYEPIAPQLVSGKRFYGGSRGPRTSVTDGLAAAGLLEVTERQYPWQRHFTAADYVELISTQSDHILLPAEQLRAVLDAVGAAVTELGGLDVSYECLLLTAVAP